MGELTAILWVLGVILAMFPIIGLAMFARGKITKDEKNDAQNNSENR